MTELDHTILGALWQQGAISAYQLRQVFARSPTSTWSSSTGSIYPAVRRLVASGLIEASEPSGGRGVQKLSITAAGLDTLRNWLKTITSRQGAATADPIRTRVNFLSILAPDEQMAVLADSKRSTEEAIANAEAKWSQLKRERVPVDQQISAMGVVLQLRARRDWILEVERMCPLSPERPDNVDLDQSDPSCPPAR